MPAPASRAGGRRTEVRRSHADRREAARSSMLSAAMTLLAHGGYSHMTLVNIGEATGFSQALVLHYFGSKSNLLQAIIDSTKFWREEAEAKAKHLDGRTRIEQWVDRRFHEFRTEPDRSRAFLIIAVESSTLVPEVGPAVHEHNRLVHEHLESAVRSGMADGSIPKGVDARMVAVAMVGLLRGVGYEWFANPSLDLRPRHRYARRILATLLAVPSAPVRKAPAAG